MSEHQETEFRGPPQVQGQGQDGGLTIAALRDRGAHRIDPVGFRFIEALARRAEAHGGDVRRILDGKLARLLAEYGERCAKARSEAAVTHKLMAANFPRAAVDFDRLHGSGDFRGLRRLGARLEGQADGGALADLVQQLARHASDAGGDLSADGAAPGAGSAGELRTLRLFRSTWSRLGASRQLARSLAKLPLNAGPLNSHRLALRALESMRCIAPAYLEQFISYVDALMWLDQASRGCAPLRGDGAGGEADKKRKPGRPKPG